MARRVREGTYRKGLEVGMGKCVYTISVKGTGWLGRGFMLPGDG